MSAVVEPQAVERTTASQLIRLTGGQLAGMMTATASGFAAWLIAARVFSPSDVGISSRLIAAGTLASGLVAAGTGQSLLGLIPHLSTGSVRIVMRWILLATAISALLAGVASVVVVGTFPSTGSLLLVAVAVSVSLTTVQDAVYIAAGRALDIAAKATTIGFTKLAALLLVSLVAGKASLTGFFGLTSLLVIPQLALSLAWLAIRVPSALAVKRPPLRWRPPPVAAIRMGYAYALGAILIAWGIPAVVTTALSAERAALFYVAWTLVTILGSISAAVANSIVGSGHGRSRRVARRIVAAHVVATATFSLGLLIVAPTALGFFGNYYVGAIAFLPALIIGQFLSGITAVLIALLRLTAAAGRTVLAIAAWATCSFALPSIAALSWGDEGFLVAYPIAAAGATAIVLALSFDHLRLATAGGPSPVPSHRLVDEVEIND